MQLDGYFKKYFESVMAEMESAIRPEYECEETRDELAKALGNRVWGLDGPRIITKRPEDKSVFIFTKLFKPLSELITNMDALENISIYVARFPYSGQKVSRLDYLKYHIENYLNELYILKNRLIAYLTSLERAYRKSDNIEQIKRVFKPLYNNISESLEAYVNIRGAHVHKNRYTDEDLDRLSTLSVLATSQDENFKSIIQPLFIAEYKKVRKKWVRNMKRDIQELHQILSHYFKAMSSVLIDKGKIIYPANAAWE